MPIFIQKRRQEIKPANRYVSYEPEPITEEPKEEAKNVEEPKQEVKNSNEMTTQEKIEMANQVLGAAPKVKRIKSDKGLIERAESNKTILMEDNRELLVD